MDASAISLCMDNNLPIMVFNMRRSENIVKAICGDLSIGTLVSNNGALDFTKKVRDAREVAG